MTQNSTLAVGYKFAARRYREEIVEQYDRIQIYGQVRPANLLDIYTDVHVMSKPIALQRYDIENLQEWFQKRDRATSLHHREERRPGLDMLVETDKLFILGRPGAGKTTFLKHLAVRAAGDHARLPYIPIFISLKEYADSGDDLVDFIERQFAICDFAKARPFIERMLEKGKALVLFDGLDEVSEVEGWRSQIIDELRDFARQYRESAVVITCRVAAEDFTFEGFTYVEMADFTPEQVENFVSRWFAEHDDIRQRMLDELGKPDNKGIVELTQNPLLLTLLCIAYEETLAFPARRVEVYEDALDALLRKWDTSRKIKRDDVYRKLSLGRKRQMLARIAHETFSKGEYFIPQRKLEKLIVDYLARVPEAPEEVDIDGEAVLKAIAAQHGLLVERSQRIFSFSHLTFQEYFTAKYIVDHEARGSLSELMPHAFDDPWREVFLLVASLLDDADSFVKHFIEILNRFCAEHYLIVLLSWAEQTGERLQKQIDEDAAVRDELIMPYQSAARRILAIYLHFSLTHSSPTVPFLDPSIQNLNTSRRGTDSDFEGFIRLEPSVDLDRDPFLGLDLAINPSNDRNYNNDYHRKRNIDRAERLGLFDLRDALKLLKRPKYDASSEEWLLYTDELQAIIAAHRPSALILQQMQIKIAAENAYPVLSDEQWRSVAEYLKAARLLFDCLDVAYVSDRKAIEDQLLLPPS